MQFYTTCVFTDISPEPKKKIFLSDICMLFFQCSIAKRVNRFDRRFFSEQILVDFLFIFLLFLFLLRVKFFKSKIS